VEDHLVSLLVFARVDHALAEGDAGGHEEREVVDAHTTEGAYHDGNNGHDDVLPPAQGGDDGDDADAGQDDAQGRPDVDGITQVDAAGLFGLGILGCFVYGIKNGTIENPFKKKE
jgi:hypothetical protein